MKRREFIALLSGAATWPFAAHAQKAIMPVVGFANGQSPAAFAHFVDEFRQGLSQIGCVDGQNVAIEYRWAEGKEDRMPDLIDDLVRRNVSVLVISGSGQGSLAARRSQLTFRSS